MAVSATQSATSSGTADTATSGIRDISGQFLKLLAAELKYQDPMSPMEDRDFMAQVAQISTVESVNKMSQSLREWTELQSKMTAASMVGRNVTAIVDESPVQGLVWGVRLTDGVKLLVDDTEIELDDVIEVR